jgi:hypothetical protein
MPVGAGLTMSAPAAAQVVTQFNARFSACIAQMWHDQYLAALNKGRF